jgi:sialidase-1
MTRGETSDGADQFVGGGRALNHCFAAGRCFAHYRPDFGNEPKFDRFMNEPGTMNLVSDQLLVRHPSLNAYHPSLICQDDRNWIVVHDLGTSSDALDYRTVARRSQDGGASWDDLGPLLDSSAHPETTHTIRVSRLRDGRLVGFGKLEERSLHRVYRCNRETLGQVPMQLFWIESLDDGSSWSSPKIIDPPLEGPTWELCHHLIELPDGAWGAPVATWRDWEGILPNGHQTGILISRDHGTTWPEFRRTFDGRKNGRIQWEQSVISLGGDQLLATAWAFDPNRKETLPSVFTTSSDGGRTFYEPTETGIFAQTCKVLALGEGRVAAAYRRHDEPGLWMDIAEVGQGSWRKEHRFPLWLGAKISNAQGENPAEQLRALSFGYPSMQRLSDHRILLVFWCEEEGRTNLRLLTIDVESPGS